MSITITIIYYYYYEYYYTIYTKVYRLLRQALLEREPQLLLPRREVGEDLHVIYIYIS